MQDAHHVPLPSGTAVEEIAEDLVLLVIPIPPPRLPGSLTAAEGSLARSVYKGESTERIARARSVTPSTVSNQLEVIYRKLAVTSRAELTLLLRGHRCDSESG